MGLYLNPQGESAVAQSIAMITVGESATPAWASLVKVDLLRLGLHWDVTVYYLDSKAPTKKLLSVDGCQMIVAEGT